MEQVPLARGVDLTAYRILQEALTNALRHSGSAHPRVTVRYLPEAVELEVVDDGRSASKATRGGHGLVGMRERVAMYDGTFASGTEPDGGYAVRVHLPHDGIPR